MQTAAAPRLLLQPRRSIAMPLLLGRVAGVALGGGRTASDIHVKLIGEEHKKTVNYTLFNR
jgi:hypothetical protein